MSESLYVCVSVCKFRGGATAAAAAAAAAAATAASAASGGDLLVLVLVLAAGACAGCCSSGAFVRARAYNCAGASARSPLAGAGNARELRRRTRRRRQSIKTHRRQHHRPAPSPPPLPPPLTTPPSSPSVHATGGGGGGGGISFRHDTVNLKPYRTRRGNAPTTKRIAFPDHRRTHLIIISIRSVSGVVVFGVRTVVIRGQTEAGQVHAKKVRRLNA